MKKTKALIIFLMVTALIFSACSGGGNEGTTSSGSEADKQEEVVLKVAFFQGGFGDAWFKYLKEEFEKTHEGITVKLEGDPNLNDTIDPKVEGGVDTPDVFFVNGRSWSKWGPQDLVMELSDLYDSKVPGTEFTLNEYIQDAVKDRLFYDPDKSGIRKYAVPWSAGSMSIVYNNKMFKEHGWTYPKTWDEFEKLCGEIKAEGIAPLIYPGQYVNYVRSAYRGWQLQSLGEEKFKEYKYPSSSEIYGDEALRTPWEKWETLFKNGWIMEGTTALNHTQSQMEFINNNAAMMFNGFWLENEMKEVWPEDYDIRMAPIPADGKLGKSTMLLYMPDYGAIASKTKHPEVAKEFLLFSLSPEASRKFTELSGGLRALKYDMKDIETTEFTKSCMEIMADPDVYTYTDASSHPVLGKLYKEFSKPYLEGIATGKMNSEKAFKAFKENAEKEYEKVKKDLGN